MNQHHHQRFCWLFWSIAVVLFPTFTVAYPTRAGHCQSGAEIGEASGGVHGREGSGSLEDGGFSVSFNSTLLTDGDPLLLGAGIEYSVSIEGGTFRGFLLRISGLNGEELQESLIVIDEDETQLLPSTGEKSGFESACAEDVAGLCHMSRDEKETITAAFKVDEEADVQIDVTVVTNNAGSGSNDWFFSNYRVNVRQIEQVNQTESEGSGDGDGDNVDSGDGDSDEGDDTSGDGDGNDELPSTPLGGCKWFCSVIPTPWLSEEADDYPKCAWAFSCSACPECQEDAARRHRRFLR